MGMTNNQFTSALEPILKLWTFDGYAEVQSMIPQMANVIKSTKYEETYQDYVGLDTYQEFSGNVNKDEFVEGYQKKIANKTYTNSVDIDYDLMDDEQYPIMKQRSEKLGENARYSREILFNEVFEHAFDTTLTGGDSLALCSSAHTSPKSGVPTQSNSGSTALSQTSITSTRTLMRKYLTPSGKRYAGMPDSLIIPVDLETTAIKAAESMFSSATFESNPIATTYKPKIFILPYYSDTNNWFMADSKAMKKSLFWQNRDAFRVVTFDDPRVRTLSVIGSYRCAVGFNDWRFIYGHNVA